MINLNLILTELFISISIMILLIVGVYKKKSSNLVYNLSIISLLIALILNFNLLNISQEKLFNGAYVIDNLSTFMKFLIIISGIFVMLTSSKYLINYKIFKIEYPILILSSLLGMVLMIAKLCFLPKALNPLITLKCAELPPKLGPLKPQIMIIKF